ncbi:GMC oxidoreductase [Canariomyces notabilis]|uniref:GMC oxidoreductase n=1 Tax=Canariomyces notabilis TaxID=2074819 RepID=A0AAN6T6W2_9PEZI|nr:GMC oxidoreductase [Canariomyces arenarius]
MGLYTKLPSDIQEVDVIIAGGGTAGCVVAARLAQANPSISILVIEGGTNNEAPSITFPALFLANLLPTSKTNLFYAGIPEAQLGGRSLIVPSGGVLSGGSGTNLLMYTRAQRSDFDSWNTAGWSADDMLPYLRKLETYHGPGPKQVHGYKGPVQVSGGPFRALRSESDFIAAAKQVGWPEIEDLQTLDANNGVQRAVRYVSPEGRRQDAATTYVKPLLADKHNKYPNLHVLVEHQVVRVLVENKRAVGVEFQANPDFQPGETGSTHTIRARKLVVVSCGACGTPLVLERSGIGSREVLDRAGVQQVADVPGVGHQYLDHNLVVYPYKSSLNPDETLDAIVSGRANVPELIQNQAPILGWNSMDITMKIRPTDEDVAALGPGFQSVWDRDFRNKPDRPLAMMSLVNAFPGDPSSVPPGQYFAVSVFTVYPYSRGHLHITGPSVGDPLDFATGFFSDAGDIDIKKHMWAYKKQREIARRMDVYRGEIAAAHPPFPAGSKAAAIDLVDGPLPKDVTDIEYTAEDDAVLEKWLRENVGTTWHSLGTCKMAPRDQYGVVDANLSVYGVEGLKIADLSIPPSNVAANTNNTALAIGERAADIFIAELGLGGKK